MFITKKHLSRRTVLRGMGTAVALPLLDAMIPAASVQAQTAAGVKPRMGYIFFPHGAVMDRWTPEKVGTDFVLPEILKSVEGFKSKMTVVSGLRNRPAESSDPHGLVAGTWLRCVSPGDTEQGITCDQVAAKYLGQETTFPSLQVATPTTGPCAPGFSCDFGSSLSFQAPQRSLTAENNPRKLFFSLFGQGDNADQRYAIMGETRSILDSVMADANALQKQLGAQDNVIVGNYLESVREVERRLQMMQNKDMSDVDIPAAPVGVPSDFEEHLKLMFDMIALAYQVNMTNVATFMMEKEVSMRTYNNVGVNEAFHPLSHHGNDPAKMARLARVQAFHTEMFSYFLQRLDAMPEGNGSVLDNSIILFGSNMSNSNSHNQDPLPNAVFGHGAGTIKGGQHLLYPPSTPHANLLLTLLNRAGIEEQSFGDSTGVLAEI